MKSREADDVQSTPTNELDDVNEKDSLRCLECDVSFGSEQQQYAHLTQHVRQPFVKLDRLSSSNPPLKITLKNRSGSNSFEIVSPVPSPTSSEPGCRPNSLEEVPREGQEHHDEIDKLLDAHQETEERHSEEQEDSEEFHDQELLEAVDQQNQDFDSNPDPFEGIGDNLSDHTDHLDHLPGSTPGSEHSQEAGDDRASINFSPNLAEVIGGAFLADIDSPIPFEAPSTEPQPQESPKEADTAEDSNSTGLGSLENSGNTAGLTTLTNGNHANSPPYGSIPGAEPTPPPEPSPTGATEYHKIKVKTTGLFKDPEPRGCTITEITDDNPTGDPSLNGFFSGNNHPTPIWATPSLEDPLKLPDSDNLLNLFNSDRSNSKDLGYSSSSDNEFISLDTYNERNRGGTMQLYNPNSAVATASSLETLTGLPMQALAQQVSRLNPSNGQGLHQQNVLINIQQFPTQPPQQAYNPQQHPQHQQPMYPPHYPPHPGQPPMHQPYPYQPPNPMYPHYPPAPGYPPQHAPNPHMPPPQHQMGQMQPPQMGQQPGGMGGPGQQPNSMVPSSQGQQMPPPNQMPQQQNNMQGGYRPPMPPNGRAPTPRGPQPGNARMPGGPRPPMGNRAPGGMRGGRAPMIVRPRGGSGAQPMRGQMRPRMGAPQNGLRPGQQSPIKRHPDQNSAAAMMQAKRKRVDVLTPSDKDDDDCQVICMQPKNTGLPQIESVQGASESVENSIMKLSDSITLSVRNPPPKSMASPQKSEAKAVANVLASRGITVTPSAKPVRDNSKPTLPTALSLNGAVSIVAASKNAGSKPTASDNLPTVDLTDDSPAGNASPGKNRPGLPYRCDLCPAQYPNAMGLNKHRQTYHKTTSGMCELGVPLINIKQPGIMQKLSQMGINNYIPLPSAGPEGHYALPIISTKSPGNLGALGATQMLSLGPVRNIAKPGEVFKPNNSPVKK